MTPEEKLKEIKDTCSRCKWSEDMDLSDCVWLIARVEQLEEFVLGVSPAWLPSEVRLWRRRLLNTGPKPE